MGTTLSHISYVAFECFNEFLIGIGSGIFGLVVLCRNSSHNSIWARAFLFGTSITCILYMVQDNRIVPSSRNKIVFVTGCDSGLGFSLAQHCQHLGYTVIAGCLSIDSKGAKELTNLSTDNIKVLELDVTKSHSVNSAVRYVERHLARDTANELWAVINNAGVMVFGEVEWQTETLIQQQLDVNLFGTIRISKQFSPLLRKYKGRIINITSHCALETLPGLSIYGATKSAIQSLSDGMRVEMRKYGINVITFIPGSFVAQSQIMARHTENAYQMNSDFSTEQKIFYGDYFQQYNAYLSAITVPSYVCKIDDDVFYRKFSIALMSERPSPHYKHETFYYKIYHALFRYCSTPIRDYFVQRFMQMPNYTPRKIANP